MQGTRPRGATRNPHVSSAAWALALVGALLALAPLAAAHATPVEAFPPRDGHLSQSPASLWAVFSEPLDPTSVRIVLYDADFEVVPIPAPIVTFDRVVVPLPQPLPDGGYVVKWVVVDAVGGHLETGGWSFAIGNAAVPPTADFGQAGFSWDLAASKYVGYVGLAILAGVAAARSYLVAPAALAPFARRLRQAGILGAGVLLAAALSYFLAQASLVGASPLDYARASFGRVLLLRVAVAAGVLAWLLAWRAAAPTRWSRLVDVACVLLVAFSYGMTGHTAGKFPVLGIGALVSTLHLASTIAWTGGLAALSLVLRSERLDPLEAKRAGQRFSALATLCVVVVAATGLLMLLGALGTDFGSWGARLATPYGALIGLMIVLGALMMAMGGANRFRQLKAFAAAPSPERRKRFRANVFREACLGVVVLLVAAGGTTLSPPAAADEAYTLTSEDLMERCALALQPTACYVQFLQQIQTARGVQAAFDVLNGIELPFQAITDGGSGTHSLGHELGRNNFLRHGDIHLAIENCGEAGFQACLHGSIQEYFLRASEVTPETVLDVCSSGKAFNTSFCVHGVGHGVFLANNYTLAPALDLCDAYETPANRSSCYSGAFMENMDSVGRHRAGVQTHGDDGDNGMVDPNDLSYPCNAVERSYRQMCWVYQPQLILPFVDFNVSRVVEQCEAIPREDNATSSCYSGLGGYLGGASNYAPTGLRRCATMPSTDGQTYCVAGFVGTSLDNASPKVGLGICRGAMGSQKPVCYASLGFSALRVMPIGDIATLCSLAESGYENTCRAGAGLPGRS